MKNTDCFDGGREFPVAEEPRNDGRRARADSLTGEVGPGERRQNFIGAVQRHIQRHHCVLFQSKHLNFSPYYLTDAKT